jgi:hypothetical protein
MRQAEIFAGTGSGRAGKAEADGLKRFGGKENAPPLPCANSSFELPEKQVGPNQRLLPSSEGLTAAVEVKAPAFVNLRFKDLVSESRTGQGKIESV